MEISKLSLDLKNYRTVPQKKEADAIKAMIAIKSDKFYAIMESIIEDGYLPTENIILLKTGSKYVVKEGNRRIAALKLIHGFHKIEDFNIKTSIITSISDLDKAWKKANSMVPCTIFNESEEELADKVVALAHGKGEKASRDEWSSVATARHNRDAKGVSEPALDLLEKYLKFGNNLNNLQRERWAGEYPLTVLHEALRVIHPRLGYRSTSELVQQYPKIKHVSSIEKLAMDIGLETVHFKTIRNTIVDFAVNYGAEPIIDTSLSSSNNTSLSVSPTADFNTSKSQKPSKSETNSTTLPPVKPSPKAFAVNDPKNVSTILKRFNPRGDRAKVVTLRDELKKLDIAKNPIAFCFLLRSMFEISAKAYCKENAINLKHPSKNGKPAKDKTLAELLREVNKNLIAKDGSKAKELHGATTEITRKEGILSVTSMNQLVHNETFSVQPPDICTLFGNIFPLVDAMN